MADVRKEILYKDRKVLIEKAYSYDGREEVGMFYDFVQNQFYFKSANGQTKTLNNANFSESPIIPTNPKIQWSLLEKIEKSSYAFNTENTTYIKFNSDTVDSFGYDLVDVPIETIAFPINDRYTFIRPQSKFRFSSIKLFVVDSGNDLAGDWSEYTTNELRDFVLAETPTFSISNRIVTTNSPSWVNYESKDFYRLSVPNFIWNSERTIVLAFTVDQITDLDGFGSIIAASSDTALSYNDRVDGQTITGDFWIPLLFNI